MGHPPQCYYFFRIHVLNSPDMVRDELIKDVKDVLEVNVHPPSGLKIALINMPIWKSSSFLVRGGYDHRTNTIFLSNRLWCRKTFIHELLHSLSYFSLTPELYEISQREIDFVEGLTELLTGCILYSKYSECYNKWISKTFPICSISYENYVRLLGAIAQTYISISDLIKIYVYDPGVNWFNIYQGFLDRYGLDDFLVNKPRKKRKIPSTILLGDIIIRELRKRFSEEKVDEFRELLEAPLNIVLDYSNMIR